MEEKQEKEQKQDNNNNDNDLEFEVLTNSSSSIDIYYQPIDIYGMNKFIHNIMTLKNHIVDTYNNTYIRLYQWCMVQYYSGRFNFKLW